MFIYEADIKLLSKSDHIFIVESISKTLVVYGRAVKFIQHRTEHVNQKRIYSAGLWWTVLVPRV